MRRRPSGQAEATGATTTRRRRAQGDGGAALIEFAILAPLIFALIVGTFTGGMSLSRKNSMTNAVREGARLGATLTEDGTWADVVRTRVVELSAGDLTSSQVCVKLVKAPATTKRASSCAGSLTGSEPSITGVPAGDCVVLVWAGRTSELEVIFFSRQLDLNASSVARFERTCT